ncbi:hypothetical protein Tco_0091223 [Tanacetum coccineum]
MKRRTILKTDEDAKRKNLGVQVKNNGTAWLVAAGGDDMATWPVPTALPGILLRTMEQHGIWLVAGGGDDMATWLVPTALPGIPHNDWIKQKGNLLQRTFFGTVFRSTQISDAIKDEKVGNKTSKMYNLDHASGDVPGRCGGANLVDALGRYGTNALSKFSPDTKLVLYPLQDKLTSGDMSLDLSAFKLSRLFFSLLSSGSSSCWRSYGG